MERCDTQRSKCMGMLEQEWYDEATTSRAGWRALCREALAEDFRRVDHHSGVEVPPAQVQCQQCKRFFRRESDKK